MLIHRYWEGAPPAWVNWTEEAVRSRVTGTFQQVDEHLFPGRPGSTPARRSNIIRLELLIEHGGMWLDCDFVPLVDLGRLRDGPWTAYSSGMARLGACFFPEPGHPALVETLQRALSAPDVALAEHYAQTAHEGVEELLGLLPHTARGRWVLPEGVEPLADHFWRTSGGLD